MYIEPIVAHVTIGTYNSSEPIIIFIIQMMTILFKPDFSQVMGNTFQKIISRTTHNYDRFVHQDLHLSEVPSILTSKFHRYFA